MVLARPAGCSGHRSGRGEAYLPGHQGPLHVCMALVLTLGGKHLSYLFFELYVCFFILLSILPTPEIF